MKGMRNTVASAIAAARRDGMLLAWGAHINGALVGEDGGNVIPFFKEI